MASSQKQSSLDLHQRVSVQSSNVSTDGHSIRLPMGQIARCFKKTKHRVAMKAGAGIRPSGVFTLLK